MTNVIQIRDMQTEDAESVTEIYIDSWRQTYASALEPSVLESEIVKRFSVEKQVEEAADQDIITLVATRDNKIIGASLSTMDERHQAWIDRIHVLDAYRGKGIAGDLLKATLVKHSGLQSIALKVIEGNDRAIAFYEKHGFSKTDLIENAETIGGANAIVMSRTIPRS